MRNTCNLIGNAKLIRCIHEIDLHLLPRKEILHQAGKDLLVCDRCRVITEHF